MSKFAKLTEKDQLKVELQSLGVENPTAGRYIEVNTLLFCWLCGTLMFILIKTAA